MKQEDNLFNLRSARAEPGHVKSYGAVVDDSNDNQLAGPTGSSDSNVSQRDSVLSVRSTRGQALPAGVEVFSAEDPKAENSESFDDTIGNTTLQTGLRRFGVFAICLVVTVISGVVLLLLTQSAILLREIGAWIPVARYIGYASLLSLWSGVAIASAQMLFLLFKLRTSPSLSASALLDLQSRNVNRNKAMQNQKLAVDTLREFLDNYPQDERQTRLLGRAGFCSKGIATDEFHRRRVDLLQKPSSVSQQWLKHARDQIFHPLDLAADKLVSASAYKIAVGTAVSPRGIADSMIMLVGLFKLTEDLCRLYAVRPSWFGTTVILAQVLVTGIASSAVDEAGDKLHDEISSRVSEMLGGITTELVSQLGARSAEGTVNLLFVRRIGQRLKYHLQPLRE